WSYYPRSCTSTKLSGEFFLEFIFLVFIPRRRVHSCFTQERWRGSNGKRIRAGWIRTAGQRQLLTAATTSCELRFGRASTSWKAYQVYFQMDPVTCPYLFWSGRNCHFTPDYFLSMVLRHLFWPNGLCIQVGPIRGAS
ncbi:Os08g0298800, partial [Oryza sativa Japonica Group]